MRSLAAFSADAMDASATVKLRMAEAGFVKICLNQHKLGIEAYLARLGEYRLTRRCRARQEGHA
jgi:hypothetical protein